MKAKLKDTLEPLAAFSAMVTLMVLLLLAQAQRKPHDCNQRGCCKIPSKH
jgi:hypothetical protein